jgi:hypothetical protein
MKYSMFTILPQVMIDKVFGKLNAVKENATVIGSIILNNAVGDLQNMHVKVLVFHYPELFKSF